MDALRCILLYKVDSLRILCIIAICGFIFQKLINTITPSQQSKIMSTKITFAPTYNKSNPLETFRTTGLLLNMCATWKWHVQLVFANYNRLPGIYFIEDIKLKVKNPKFQ